MFVFNENAEHKIDIIKRVIQRNKTRIMSNKFSTHDFAQVLLEAGINFIDMDKQEVNVFIITSILYELAKVNPSLSHAMATTFFGFCYPILKYGNEEQIDQFVGSIVREKKDGVLACSENLTVVEAKLSKDKERIWINAHKTMITNVFQGDYAIVLVTSGKASSDLLRNQFNLTAVVVDLKNQAVKLGKKEETMGLEYLEIADILITNYEITQHNIIDAIGSGGKIILDTTNLMRISNSAIALGICESSYEETRKYISTHKERYQINEIEEYAKKELALLKSEIEIMKLAVFYMAEQFDKSDIKNGLKCAVSKLRVTETSKKICSKCIDIVGAVGCRKNSVFEKAFRDIRIMPILGGHSERIKEYIAVDL